MSHDGKDPPTPEPGTRAGRPKLSVIRGGAGIESERPEAPALARSGISPEGRAKVLRILHALGGERAFLFVWDDREFTLSEACACDESGAEPRDRNVMWSLLDRITSRRCPLVMAGTDDQASDALMSGVTSPLRMAVAVPLMLGEVLKGVACFDKRIHRGQFALGDARAAMFLLDRLGLEPGHMELLRKEGVPEPAPCPEVSSAALLLDLRDKILGGPHREHAQLVLRTKLATPTEHEVCFWTQHEPEPNVERLIMCRLRQAEGPSDLLVTRLLACFRALSLFVASSVDEQLHGLAFELTRAGLSGFELHLTVLELHTQERRVAIWQAGDGIVLGVSHARGVEALVGSCAPITREHRAVTRERRALMAGERVVCSHGAPIALDARAERAQDLDELLVLAGAEGGPPASLWCLELP